MLTAHSLRDLQLLDEASFRHVGLWTTLRTFVERDDQRFWVAEGASWDHASVLNLVAWGGSADVLTDKAIPADVVMHAAWHRAARSALGPAAGTVAGLLVAESIASAFDVYLVGRLLGHAPDSDFLATQVPRLTEAALEAGLTEEEVEELFETMAAAPEAAFAELRAVLGDVSLALARAVTPQEAHAALLLAAGRPMGAFLHHFELPAWVLYARAHGAGEDTAGEALHQALSELPDPLGWLEEHWLGAK
jgi:hypothetical protein